MNCERMSGEICKRRQSVISSSTFLSNCSKLLAMERLGGEVLRHEGPHPSPQHEHARLLQVAIDAGDGVGVDPEFHRQGTHGGHQVSGLQIALLDQQPDLAFELDVQRDPVVLLDLEWHR